MYVDKRAAVRGRRRIPELSFYTIGMLLGAMGLLLASRAFRHKTQKQPFRTWMWVLLLWNVGVFYYFLF